MLELVSPDPGLEREKGVFEDTLRWEDDGGPIFEADRPIPPQPAETNTPRPQDAYAGEYLL